MEMEDEKKYKVFKSIRLVNPKQDGILEDNALASLLNEWYDRGYTLWTMTTNTTAAGESLVMETTVILEQDDDHFDDYDDYDDDEEDDEDDEDGDDYGRDIDGPVKY